MASYEKGLRSNPLQLPSLCETNAIVKQLEADIGHIEETTPDLLARQASYREQWHLFDDSEV